MTAPYGIFQLINLFGCNSPWEEDWTDTDFQKSTQAAKAEEKQRVKAYTHPDKKTFESQKTSAQTKYDAKKKEYIDYYKKIGKINDKSTETQIQAAFTEANKAELKRLKDSVDKNDTLLTDAKATEKQWNKLDTDIEDVVYDFNIRKKFTGTKKLDPNLVKALMFSESEMGAGVDYKKLVESVPISNPKAVYQLNLGRVTDAYVYNDVVKEYSIPVNWQTNYKDMGNKNDVMLAAGALIKKKEYADTITSSNFKTDSPWFNAVVAYKGVSAEGNRKASLTWKLYENGDHPYTSGKKLF